MGGAEGHTLGKDCQKQSEMPLTDIPNLYKAIQDGDLWDAVTGTLLIPGMDEAAPSPAPASLTGSQDHVSGP